MNWKASILMLLANAHIATGEILQECNDETVREVLTQEVTDLKIDSLDLIGVGWDNWVAEVNSEWIFRFPRRESISKVFRREDALLQALASNVNVEVPKYTYKGTKTDFVGYRKIKGDDLTEEAYNALSDEQKAELAETFADFLLALHQTFTVDEARELGFKEQTYNLDSISALKGTLASEELEKLLEDQLRDYRNRDLETMPQVLTHGDLCPENVAFDRERGVLNGVFDFTDATISTVALDLQKLFLIHPTFVKEVASRYARKTGGRELYKEAAQDFVLTRFYYLSNARRQGNKEREEKMISDLNHFLHVM